MHNLDNPYNNLLAMMKEEGSSTTSIPFMVGEVKSTSPLVVNVSGIDMQRESFLINKAYLNESDNVVPSTFKNGDRVVVLVSKDQQQLILACRVG